MISPHKTTFKCQIGSEDGRTPTENQKCKLFDLEAANADGRTLWGMVCCPPETANGKKKKTGGINPEIYAMVQDLGKQGLVKTNGLSTQSGANSRHRPTVGWEGLSMKGNHYKTHRSRTCLRRH